MKPAFHAAASFAIAGTLYLYTAAGASCFIAGVFIDLDHIPDYILQGGLKNTSRGQALKDFFSSRGDRLYLVLHSYELLFILLLAGRISGWSMIMLGTAAGAASHMVIDQVSNGIKYNLAPLFYFLTLRAMKGFRKELLTGDPAGTMER